MIRKGFTLIELLVVIAIIAILAVVVVLTLNPAELLRQSRDANRVSDVATLTSALNLYITDLTGASSFSLGNSASTSISIYDPNSSSTCGSLGLPAFTSSTWYCSNQSNNRSVSGPGWIPVNLSNISAGTPIGSLPVDPTNQTSSGLFYSYSTNGNQFETTANLESQKYKTQYANNPQTPSFPDIISGGVPTISNLYNPTGLVGYWPLNEGSGSSTLDGSGNGNNGTWNGSTTNGTYYTSGKIGTYGGNFNGTNNYITLPNTTVNVPAFTVNLWFNPSVVNGAAETLFDKESQLKEIMQSGTVYMGIGCTSTSSWSDYATTGYSPSANTWAMTSLTLNGTQAKFYANGVLLDTYSLACSVTSYTNNGLTINGVNNELTGVIDDVRFYNRALSPAEVVALYNAGK